MRRVVSGKIPSSKDKESLTVLKKNIPKPTGPQRTSWRVLRVATISLSGILLLASGNLELANAYYYSSVFFMDFPGSSDGKASAYNAGDPGSIPGSG